MRPQLERETLRHFGRRTQQNHLREITAKQTGEKKRALNIKKKKEIYSHSFFTFPSCSQKRSSFEINHIPCASIQAKQNLHPRLRFWVFPRTCLCFLFDVFNDFSYPARLLHRYRGLVSSSGARLFFASPSFSLASPNVRRRPTRRRGGKFDISSSLFIMLGSRLIKNTVESDWLL